MLTPNYASRFKKDLKLAEKRGLDMREIYKIMIKLEKEEPLPPKNKEHLLQGDYAGFTECHIEPDWLLVYKIDKENKDVGEIYFARTGTHSDLF